MQGRVGFFVIALLAAGCARLGSGLDAGAAVEGAHPASMATPVLSSMQRGSQGGGVDPLRGFARLPDRGELLRYDAATVRRNGAYTWHRADISEAHALHALAAGHLYVTTPDGQRLDFQYDRHVEHASGDWTWVGHIAGRPSEQAILTFGSDAAFGSIAQVGKLPLRMTVRDGVSWLVETDPVKLASINSAAAHPRRPDYRVVPKSELPRRRGTVQSAADGAVSGVTASSATSLQASSSGATTVDLLLGYTPGFATAYNGASGALTRLNYLVDVANAAYVNSQIGAQIRLVKAMQVNYTGSNSNDTALEEMSGYKAGTGPVTPNAAFDGLRAAREQYRADLVSLVRDFQDPVQGGCGIAWLLGGQLQGITAGDGWDELAYSVVSDRQPQGTGGYYCLDETLAHELGHNMGAAHDKDAAKGDDGVLNNPDDYGAYTFSFGYKAGSSSGIYTIMSYGGTFQSVCRSFSNPSSTFCNGTTGSTSEDNARTLRQTLPTVAGFRAALVPQIQTAPMGLKNSQADFNGDGKTDLLWLKPATGDLAIWLMNGQSRIGYQQYRVATSTRLVGYGDYDGNGKSDLLWRTSAGEIYMWLGNGSSFRFSKIHVANSDWYVAGTGDGNGDGRDDVVWHSPSRNQIVVWYMAGFNRLGYAAFPTNGLQLVSVADLDGNGKDDLVWTDGSGGYSAWLSAGTTYTKQAMGSVGEGWSLISAGDVNKDHRADLHWYKASTNQYVYWLMNGASRMSYRVFDVPAGYRASGEGDFDGNAASDLLWVDDNRNLFLWESDGIAYGSHFVHTYGDGWEVWN